MRNIIFLVAMFVLFGAGLGTAQQPAPVKVEDGLLQGTYEDGLTVYKGIPFAAPPVGDLRWRPPQPAAKWEAVRQATKFGPSPIQGSGSGPDMSEDCLYLNVWTPAKSASDRIPVFVWIYGGGFNFGSTSDPNYNGANLAKKGVVLVSIAYRVGQLGFFADPELSAESPHHVSGNYGIQDMTAGLKWVKKNIAAFGGDPNKVTIFGESRSAYYAHLRWLRDCSKVQFRKVVATSVLREPPPILART
jgi:para-nitrobenzyl esterase